MVIIECIFAAVFGVCVGAFCWGLVVTEIRRNAY